MQDSTHSDTSLIRFDLYELKSHAILGDLWISRVIVSSNVTSPKVLITVVIKMTKMIVISMIILISMMIVIDFVMNNFLLVMHFVDKVWDVHSDVYAENQNQD
jgi:hypothetical protein